MTTTTLHNKIRRWIDNQESGALETCLSSLHPSVAAEALESLSRFELSLVLSLLEVRRRAEIFSFLKDATKQALIQEESEEALVPLLNYLSHDERADLITLFPPDRAEQLLKKLAIKEREDIRKLEAYDEGTIGAIMTSDYIALKEQMTVAEAMERIRAEAPDAETIYYAYILDDERSLAGVVSLKQLIMAKPTTALSAIMLKDVISVHTRAPVEAAVLAMAKSDLLALPVIDRQGKMVGIVTYDDVADVAEQASTEDFHRMAAAGGLKTLSLRSATLPQMLIKRLPWLMVLVFMNVFSGAGIAFFEDTIEAVVALVFFLPLLIDSGGNAGSQAATLMVRALAIGDVRMRDWFYFLRREIGTSLIMGICMGVGVALIAAFRAPEIIAVVAVTMACTVVTGSVIGMMLPFVLTKLKFDPAAASAPLITSLADICGVLIYFGIATWFLGIGQ
jgi:magnesium transporter